MRIMKIAFLKPAITAVFLCLFLNMSGQGKASTLDKDERVEVIVKDGSVIYGYVVESNGKMLVIRSSSLDILSIPIKEVEGIKVLSSDIEQDSKGNFIDYHSSTRYLLTPSGYGLKKGQAYYENVWIFWNSFAYGVTDNITISASTEIASILFSSNVPLIFLNAKFTLPIEDDKASFGLNVSYLTIPDNDFTSFTFLTGSATFGNRNNNLTFGFGGGFQIENGVTDEVLPFTLSYMGRIGKKLSFVTENWFIAQNDFDDFTTVISAGLRVHFKTPGNTLNLALVRPVDDGVDIIGFPFVSATVRL